MNTLSRFVVAAAVAGIVGGSLPAEASPGGEAAGAADRRTGGTIVSYVRDAAGRPLPEAIVSAVGRRIVTGVTDAEGRCEFTALPVGDYLVRVHLAGYVSATSLVVIPAPGLSSTWSFVLKPQVQSAAALPVRKKSAPAVLAAGFAAAQPGPRTVEAPPEAGDAAAGGDDHDHGEVAWRLRHAPRSVLKEATERAMAGGTTDSDFGGRSSIFGPDDGGLAASIIGALPALAGQVNLLTSSAFDNPDQLVSGDMGRGVAFLSIGAAAGRHGDWAVQAAVTQGDVSSWMVAGSYLTRAPARHVYDLGMAYSMQRYDGSNPAALAAVADGDRNAGSVYAYDSWTISSRVMLVYGAKYARHGYIERAMFSPRARLTIAASDRTRLSMGASRRALAPGAEEFVPAMVAGTWLPPERTFSPLIEGRGFQPERTHHFDASIEQDFGPGTVVGVRAFFQRTEDQLATLFGPGAGERETADLGHYYVANAGDVQASGWTVSIRQVVARRLRSSVDYTVATAAWRQGRDAALLDARMPGAVRAASEKLHDVTTSVETDLPVTETRIVALYRINSGYSGSVLGDAEPSLAARFDVQVTQSLPFMNFSNAQWEMLLGVRNLFRELVDEASIYDELLAVRPPKRIVGGLTLRF